MAALHTPSAAPKPMGYQGARSRAAYPRKRALTACETCRQRKTRCDNQRPTCGGCAELEIHCSFQDPTSVRSTYDRASLEILERINYVAGLLEAQSGPTHPVDSTSHPPYRLAESDHSNGPRSTPSQTYGVDDHLLESLQINRWSTGTCEDILEWPVFGTPFDRTRIEGLIFSPSQVARRTSTLQNTSRGVNEEQAPSLVERFLVNVHIKNPVLDPDDLRRKARHVSESGFGWDEDSCLLLVVCALSTLSSDFTPEPVTPDLVDGLNIITSLTDAGEYPTAESYYGAARKRLGLLDYTIPAAQCYFLIGVYEMYSVRPIKAWGSFKRACDTLQIYFRSEHQPGLSESGGLVGRFEIRMEVNLPPSGLANVAYSDVFPTPPSESLGPGDDDQVATPFSRPEQPELERIWSYYLSEIAVRKIGNRIMNCFYQEDASAWLTMPLSKMMRIADELELQLTQWFDNLPVILFTPSSDCMNHDEQMRIAQELQFVLQARLSDFRERIYRPFLYLAVHLPLADPAQQSLEPYLQRCISACVAFLHRGTPRHRHHGTWYENRGMFLKTLLLLAVAKSGRAKLLSSWRHGMDLCLAGFRFWEAESPDLREAYKILSTLLPEV
ncbi:Fc.00g026710.m01.CDS01 [Cosmosporella sp. VM-42]